MDLKACICGGIIGRHELLLHPLHFFFCDGVLSGRKQHMCEISPHSQITTRIIASLQQELILLKAHKHTTLDEFLEIKPMHNFVATEISVGKPEFGDPQIFQCYLLL